MTTWDIGVTNRDLGHEVAEWREAKGQDELGKADVNHKVTLCTHMELWVTVTLDVNLRKLVPLEVHDKVGNAKIAKKYFSMLEWGVPYTVGKLKRRAFQRAKEHANPIPG